MFGRTQAINNVTSSYICNPLVHKLLEIKICSRNIKAEFQRHFLALGLEANLTKLLSLS